MGELIFVDFVRREVLEPDDQDVQRMWEDYHAAIAEGGVNFPLVEEGFAALHAALFGAR